jgi:hypothetical protein
VKPVTPTLTCVEREIVPLIPIPVPDTVTGKVPGETEVCVNIVRVEVADVPEDKVTLFVLKDAPGPPETLVVKATVPLKPFWLVTVITEVPEKPDGKLREVGLAEIVKSGARLTVTVMLTE